MMAVLAFLCRITVFVLLSVLSTLANRQYQLTMYNRILVSTLQVFIFCSIVAVYEVCWWIIRGMSTVGIYKTVEELRSEERGGEVELEAADGADDFDLQQASAPPVDDIMSVSSHVTTKIVFEDSRQLRDHVWWVYFLGVLTWISIYCLDFQLLSASFFFSIGILGGWVVHSCWRYRESTPSKFLRVLYFVLLALLIALYVASHRQILDPETQFASRGAVVAVVIPTLVGMGWMYMPRENLTTTIQTSFFTCCLLCLPILVIIDTRQFQEIFNAAPKSVIAYLLAVEPILKALALYTIALSLQTGRRLDLLIVLFVCVHLDDILFHHVSHAIMAGTVTGIVLLVGLHVGCLLSVGTA